MVWEFLINIKDLVHLIKIYLKLKNYKDLRIKLSKMLICYKNKIKIM